MMKSTTHFFLLICTVFLLSGCVNTQPKVVATKKTIVEDSLNTNVNSMPLVKPNLTGLWILNRELSKNPQEELKEGMRQSSNGRGSKSMSGRGGGEHDGKGSGRRRGDGSSRNKKTNLKQGSLPQSLQALLISSETLELKHEEPLLTIITKDGQEKVYTDFRGSNVSSSNGLNQKVTIAGWENNVLVVENTLNSGRFIQQFELNSVSGQLWVNTLVLTPHLSKPVQFNRVYDQVKTGTEDF